MNFVYVSLFVTSYLSWVSELCSSLISDELHLLDGEKIIEVVGGRFNKGSAVSEIIGDKESEFMLCFGDDVTDEFMFNDLPTHSINIKVGKKYMFFLKNQPFKIIRIKRW